MSRRAPALTARAWLGAAAGSIAIHALAVLALVRGGDPGDIDRDRSPGIPWHQAPLMLSVDADWIDVLPLEEPPAAIAPLNDDKNADKNVVDPTDRAGAVADQDHRSPEAVAPRVAEGRERRKPAADQGQRAGRATDTAWRRDRSTLHARLTDGASLSQPSRLDNAASSASPQAIRREPVVGAGDSIRTETPASVPGAPHYATLDESTTGDSARSADGLRGAAPILTEAEAAHRAEVAMSTRRVGPLDTERGARSFDSEARGAARDSHNQRAASNEWRPGITDFSRAGVAATEDSPTGRGPGDAPGAVDRATPGRSPSEYGGTTLSEVGDAVSEPTQDRRYQLYIQEIARRVNSAREFPKRLALRLEQGETVVRFVLERDGHIRSGVHVMKSSGFDEFDSAAARAVERAAPFPPMPRAFSERPLTVSVRVAFENPLVR